MKTKIILVLGVGIILGVILSIFFLAPTIREFRRPATLDQAEILISKGRLDFDYCSWICNRSGYLYSDDETRISDTGFWKSCLDNCMESSALEDLIYF